MKQSDGRKRSTWFWVGVIMLSISALWWLIAVIAIVAEPEDVEDTIIGSVILTFIPIGIGVFCVWFGRQRRGVMEKITVAESQRVMEKMTGVAESQQVIASHKIGFRANIEITDKGLRVKRVNIPYSQIRECMFTRTRAGLPNRLVIRYSDQTGRDGYVRCGGMTVQICSDITGIASRYGYRIPQRPFSAITIMANQLKAYGIESDLIEPDVEQNRLEEESGMALVGEVSVWSWQLDMGGLRLRGCNIDTINVLEAGHGQPHEQWAVGNTFLYYTDCTIDTEPVPNIVCQGRPRKRYRIWIVGYEWEGSKLAPRLNDDDKLVQMLVKAKAPEIRVKGNKISFQDKKLRTVKLFWCIDRIALHLREC